MRLRSLAFDELTKRGVDPRFSRVLADPESYHPDLRILIGKTDWDYYVPEDVDDITPLWDSNADSYVRWCRNGIVEYVWLFHDDPKWALVAKSEQGVMARLWQEWIEFQDADDDECYRFAEAIGFRHCEQALALFDEDYDGFQTWARELSDDVT